VFGILSLWRAIDYVQRLYLAHRFILRPMSIHDVYLVRVRDRKPVPATLKLMEINHLEAFEQYWKPFLAGKVEGDQYWDWRFKYRTYGARSGAESYALECEGQLQGLMLMESLGYRSWANPRRRLVYIHSLATAPWNRPSIQNPPQYRLVGGTFLEFVQYRSLELGYGGIVGLHSLPGAEAFYDQAGFINCGADSEKEDLVYFECSAQEQDENSRDQVDWEQLDC
jgi:hypothetical protein